MINALKTALVNTGQFNYVHLAQEMEPLDDFQADTPAVILYYGPNKYAPSEADMLVQQAVDKHVIALLVCNADQLHDLEKLVVETVIGYTHDAEHYAMEAVESDNHKITGEYYSRKILFFTRTHVRQA